MDVRILIDYDFDHDINDKTSLLEATIYIFLGHAKVLSLYFGLRALSYKGAITDEKIDKGLSIEDFNILTNIMVKYPRVLNEANVQKRLETLYGKKVTYDLKSPVGKFLIDNMFNRLRNKRKLIERLFNIKI